MFDKRLLLLLGFLVFGPLTFAQEEEQQEEAQADPDSSGVVRNVLTPTSTPILLFTAVEDEEGKDRKKKKKTKKNVFFGEKTQRSLIKQTFRDQSHIQSFHYTQKNREVDPYIRDIYWYDRKDRVIKSKGFEPSKGYLLHGPYEKRVDDDLVESGMYYYGTKHGRWMTYSGKNILLDKSNFYEGWPKASRITYYNREEQKIEKLTPVEYDLEEGNFYHFYEDGKVAVVGEYKYGEKIGLWTEYWENTGDKLIRKREIQFQEDPFTKGFRPYIRAEWDNEGNLVYRRDA